MEREVEESRCGEDLPTIFVREILSFCGCDVFTEHEAEEGRQGAPLLQRSGEQAAYRNRSLALYAKLGFVVREPLVCLQGPPLQRALPGYRVRRAQSEDIAACNDLCLRVHGHHRGGELNDGIQQGTAVVAEWNGLLRAYASGVGFFGHAVAESNQDLVAIISEAHEFSGPGILVPSRNSALFRWCLENGLRIIQTVTLMTIGLYNEPAGAYLPSVLF